MTPILDIITNYCAQYVDDIRLEELTTDNPPLYARKMAAYLNTAIPLFNKPPEVLPFLVGDKDSPGYTPAQCDDLRYTVTEDLTAATTVQLGISYIGYELFSAHVLVKDDAQNVVSVKTDLCVYDSAKGEITINASAEQPVSKGTIFDFDFYTDGEFKNDLPIEMKSILGMCFQVVWQDRFNSDWLSNVAKVEDKSSYEQNRGRKMDADTARLDQLRRKLAEEMRQYGQNLYYLATISPQNRLKF